MLGIYYNIKRRIVTLLLAVVLSFPTFTAESQVTATSKAELGPTTPVNISKDVDISSDELEADLRKDIVIFVGNVVVQQGDLTLNSDRITVFYQKSEKGKNANSSITRIDASGSVKLTTTTETITATWGIYDFAEKIITLGGKVVLKRNDGEIKGKRLIYNLDSGMISIDGNASSKDRVKGQFTLPEK